MQRVPQVHYIPVWEKTPDDILTALDWAKAHDDEARQIAANAQQFAQRYGLSRSVCLLLLCCAASLGQLQAD